MSSGWKLSEFDRGYHVAFQDLKRIFDQDTTDEVILAEIEKMLFMYEMSGDTPSLTEDFPTPQRRRTDGRAIPSNP